MRATTLAILFASTTNLSAHAFGEGHEIEFLRCYDSGLGDALCEVLANPGEKTMCVAYSADGEPIASEAKATNFSHVRFTKMPAEQIQTVRCEYF